MSWKSLEFERAFSWAPGYTAGFRGEHKRETEGGIEKKVRRELGPREAMVVEMVFK